MVRMEMVKVGDLIKVYKTGRLEVIALRGLSLDVGRGEIVAVMGPSGCGKTTLLNLVGGLDQATAGTILVDGVDVTGLGRDSLAKHRRDKVGFVFQFFNLVPWLSAAENVGLSLLAGGEAKGVREKRSLDLLQTVGLRERSRHRPDELSGGEQQRVAIAAALAKDPPLILADEPTGELDTEAGGEIMDLFQELNQTYRKTMIIATHDRRVARIADRVVRMEDGLIAGEGSNPILDQLTLEELRTENAALRQTITEMRHRVKALQNL